MIYDSFADFSEVLHTATSFWRTCSKPVKTFQDASKVVDLPLERLPGQILSKISPIGGHQ